MYVRIIPDADRTASGPNRAPDRNEVDAVPRQAEHRRVDAGEILDVRQPGVGARPGEARRLERVPGSLHGVSIPYRRRIRENRPIGIARSIAFRLAIERPLRVGRREPPGGRRLASNRARRYVAGQTLEEACDVARHLLDLGLAVSLDAFGELVTDPDAAAEAAASYAV